MKCDVHLIQQYYEDFSSEIYASKDFIYGHEGGNVTRMLEFFW